MKGAGMLVVSLRGVQGKTPLDSAVKVSYRIALETEILNNYIFSIRFIYSIHVIKV